MIEYSRKNCNVILALRRLRSIILVLILVFTSIFSNELIVKATETTISEEKSQKRLVQCSNDWIIFKYENSQGNPRFDITYQGKSVSEMEQEGYIFKNSIHIKMKNEPFRGTHYIFFNEDSLNCSDLTEEEKNNSFVQFYFYKYDVGYIESEVIPLFSDKSSSPYILSANFPYLNGSYGIDDGKPNCFKVSMKVSEPLKEIGELTISKRDYNNIFSDDDIQAKNLTFENVSQTYTIGGTNYVDEYSIVTFDLELPYVYYHDSDYDGNGCNATFFFSIDGLLGLYSNEKIEDLEMLVSIPGEVYPTDTPTDNNSKDILVEYIKINASSTQIQAGKKIKLNASVNSDATNKSIVWSSSNRKYATVDKNGLVTTKKTGAGKTVTITAKATDDSGKTATFKLKIKKVSVKKLKLKVSKKSIKVGKKLKIKAVITPSNASNKNIKWSVSNKKYAKINSKGVLTAKKVGAGKTVKITAKAKDGSGKKATIKIKIKK